MIALWYGILFVAWAVAMYAFIWWDLNCFLPWALGFRRRPW